MTLVVLLATFIFYLHTMPGTIPVYRDSGDLVSAITSLGIAHPPGYPLYVLLGKLHGFLIPWATQAYRANAFSALAAALAAAALYRIVHALFVANEVALPKLYAAGLSMAYALSPAVVSLARTSEMYALESFFAVLILGCCCCPGKAYPRTAVFLLTLGMGVHPTLLFLLPLVALGIRDRSRDEPSLWVQSAGVFFLGATVFLFLPLRGSVAPVLMWGDPLSCRGLWRLITRADYGGLKLHPVQSEFIWTPQIIYHQAVYFVRQSLGQGGAGGVALAAGGILAASFSSSSTRPSRALVAAFVLAGPLFFILSNLPQSEATTPAILEPYLVLVSLLGMVISAYALVWLARRVSPVAALGVLLAVWVLAAPLRAALLSSSRDHYYAYDYGRNLLRSLPPGAVLYDPDDPTAFTIRALQLTEHRREDIVLLNFFRTQWGYEQIRRQWPDLLLPGPVSNAQELERMFWTYSIQRRPFYAELPSKVPAPLEAHSEGLVYRILPSGQAKGSIEVGAFGLTRSLASFSFVVQRGAFRTSDFSDFFTRHLLGYYAAAYCNLGLAFANGHQPVLARDLYRHALVIDPELTAAYNNLGILAYQENQFSEALRWYDIALSFKPEDTQLLQNRALAASGMAQSRN